MKTTLIALGSFLFLCSCDRNPKPAEKLNTPVTPEIQTLAYEAIRTYPHDTVAFTEGLLFHEGRLFESTGATAELPQTRSLFGTVNLQNGKIEPKVEIDRNKYFGEGIAFLNGNIYQLTYQTQVGFIYDAKTYKMKKEFSFANKEGWGLTTDGKNLIMSDGTNVLTFLDPETLQAVKTISVSENGYAVDLLNELEYVDGFIYANIWTTHKIVRIDLSTGKVTGAMDLTLLADDARRQFPGSLEMNGIAYNPAEKNFWITGKLWPKIYVLKINS